MSRPLKLLFLVRLIPLAERNYNIVELGPRGTGKSYVIQEVSPYSARSDCSNLFAPMPDIIRDDMAFIDRIHFYLPGWEIPKMRNDLFTNHYGFLVDYRAEALREMRRHNFREVIDRHFSLGTHLNARDGKAV